jgi:hypothetical protein
MKDKLSPSNFSRAWPFAAPEKTFVIEANRSSDSILGAGKRIRQNRWQASHVREPRSGARGSAPHASQFAPEKGFQSRRSNRCIKDHGRQRAMKTIFAIALPLAGCVTAPPTPLAPSEIRPLSAIEQEAL